DIELVLSTIGPDAEDGTADVFDAAVSFAGGLQRQQVPIHGLAIELKNDAAVGLHAGLGGQLAVGGSQLTRTLQKAEPMLAPGIANSHRRPRGGQVRDVIDVRAAAASDAELDLEEIELLGIFVEAGSRHAN